MNPSTAALDPRDLAIIAVYIIGVVAFGSWFIRKSRSIEEFTVGGRNLPGWAIGLSIMGTFLSPMTFLGVPGSAFDGNWGFLTFVVTVPIVCFFAARYFVPLYRGRLQTTAYEHLEARFGPWARSYASLSLIALQVGRIGAVLLLISKVMTHLLGIPIWIIVIVLGAITILYTVLGGIEAVIWTDVVQSIVLIAGAAVVTFLLATRVSGGTEKIMTIAASDDKFSLGGWRFNLATQTFWVWFIYGMIENIKNFGVDQNYVQRYLSASSDREAKKALWIGSLVYLPVAIMFLFIGTALYAHYQAMVIPPANLPAKGEDVFAYFIANEIPVGIKGLIVAAILAAGMSTLDSSINVSATVWTIDFHQRYIRPDCSERQMLRTTRLATVVVGAIGTSVSLLMIPAEAVFDIWLQIAAIFGGGMLGLFLLGVLVPRSTSRGAALGVLAGILVILWGTLGSAPQTRGLMGSFVFPYHKYLIGFAGTFAILSIGWLESFYHDPKSR